MSLLLTLKSQSGFVWNGLTAGYDLTKQNLLRFSEQLDNAAWTTTQSAVTPNVSSPAAPDGANSAEQIDGTGADGSVSQSGIPVQGDTTYTFSAWLRVDSGQQIQLSADDGFGAKGTTLVDVLSSQWTRFSTTFTTDPAATTLSVAIGGGATLTTGEVVYIWGAQLNEGPAAAAYEVTTDNQTIQDLCHFDNPAQLGSTVGADTNDPTWEAHKLRFATDDYLKVARNATINNIKGTMTIQAVVSPQSIHDGTLWSKRNSFFRIEDNLGDNTLRVSIVGGGQAIGATVLPPGWSSVAMKYDDSTDRLVHLSINGLPETNYNTQEAGAGALEDDTNFDLQIGLRGSSSEPLNGTVAFWLMYNRVLEDSEILGNHRAIKGIMAGRGITLP